MKPAAALLCLMPLAAEAQSLRCQTAGYCTNALECFDDSSIFILRDAKGHVLMGWQDDVVFPTAGVAYDGFTLYEHRGSPASIQTLVVAADLTATFSISTILFGSLYTSFQALVCERM
jgi:hypothetical protein